MKTTKRYLLIVLIILVSGCEEKAFNPAAPKVPDFSLTPMENEEAELIAMRLSGELIAPIELYNRVKDDLELIRNTWADSIVEVNITYNPWWFASRLEVYLTKETYDSIAAGIYAGWDSLNQFYVLDSIMLKQLNVLNSTYYFMTMFFKGRLNSLLLADIYTNLPGFLTVRVVNARFDGPTLKPATDGEILKYFFRNAYGDCMRGCIYSDFYYFTVQQDSALFHGSYLFQAIDPPDSTRPGWVDTALVALN